MEKIIGMTNSFKEKPILANLHQKGKLKIYWVRNFVHDPHGDRQMRESFVFRR